MFELQSCKSCLNYNLEKSPGEKKRGDASNMFTEHIAYYESTFVDENKEYLFMLIKVHH